MKSLGVLVLAVALGSCGQAASAIPDVDLLLRVSTDATPVIPGRAFPLEVVRVWDKTLEPSPWEARALAPLVLKLRGTTRRDDGRRIEERLTYDAYAFVRKDVRVPAALMAAKTPDGQLRVTRSQRKRLRVVPTVDAAAPGAPELPAVPATPSHLVWWLAGLAALLLAAAIAIGRKRAAPRRATAAPARVDPLAVLRHAEAPLDPTQVAAALRAHLADTTLPPALERTTDEVDEALRMRALEADTRENLIAVLRDADRCKYDRYVPSDDEVVATFERGLRAAERLATEPQT